MFFVTLLLASFQLTRCMEETKKIIIEDKEVTEIGTIKLEPESEQSEELKPIRIVTVIPENSKDSACFISVGEHDNTALVITRVNRNEPHGIRWYNLLNNELIKEYTNNDYYALSEGTITKQGPIVIFLKKEYVALDKHDDDNKEEQTHESSPFEHNQLPLSSYVCTQESKKILYTYNVKTEDLDPLDYTPSDNDNFISWDHTASIDPLGECKAVTVPNEKDKHSKIIIFDKNNNVASIILTKPARYMRTYFSHNGKRLITAVNDIECGWKCDLYNTENKEKPQHIKTIEFESYYCNMRQNSSLFADYKIIYDSKTGNIEEKPETEKFESVIGFSSDHYIFHNALEKTLTQIIKKNNQKIPLQKVSGGRIALKATPIKNGEEFAVHSLFPWENEPTKIYIYAALKNQESANKGYFGNCVIN